MRNRKLPACLTITFGAYAVVVGANASAADANATRTFRQYCFQCHAKAATAGVNIEQLTSQQASLGDNFQRWEKVAAALEQKRMPPAKMPQPNDAERGQAVAWIRAKLGEFAARHAGDPGRVTLRRLTSAEYGYTIKDLTGIDLKVDADVANDSVGGEGFSNFGDVQFMADANLERYLAVAKNVAAHAVVGSGPLGFFDDPGKSGFELSAMSRINEIYRAHGFRANSGEGGKPYGLDRYSKAFYACWAYRHREALGESDATLESLAGREGVSPRFVKHLWSVLHQASPAYPTSEVIAKWRSLPAPTGQDKERSLAVARAGSEDVMRAVVDWPRWLLAAGGIAEGGDGDERALVLNDATLQAGTAHQYKFNLRTRGRKPSTITLSVVPVNPKATDRPSVIWRNATIRIREKGKAAAPPQPLKAFLDEETARRLAFGKGSDGGVIDPGDFSMPGDASFSLDLAIPEGAQGTELQVGAEMRSGPAGDAILRCTISNSAEVSKGVPVWALLGDSRSAGFQAWKAGVLDFAARLPQNSQGEPAPADKDPIPPPFDNTYNQPERDHFHTAVKYFRDDRFLMENVLDDAARTQLDHAWADLTASFEYHATILHFISEKYRLDLSKKSIGELDDARIEAMPAEPRKYVKALRSEFDAVQEAQRAARPGHVEDCLRFASLAWRRPLTEAEKQGLRAFYDIAAKGQEADHAKAIRVLLARILVAPAFLYRMEQPSRSADVAALPDWELASRMSYFLWSSLPDEELRRAASARELGNPEQLERQVKRMLADPKARRMSAEFFGQWLGFYRFDQHRGVDTTRYPEFTDEVKAAMYDEAVSLFEHVIRNDRPVREMLFADYAFLNKALAKHYGVNKEIGSADGVELVSGANEFQRGGLLRLGAVLTATSAPLRTSPVKRGDWVLRRLLGTATPPPPADAGSIPADDRLFSGLTVRERLAAHQRNAACAACHARIDPLGFPLERYDSLGRWRTSYSGGKPIHDSGTLADRTEIAGVEGLLRYLKTQEGQVLRTLSRKLLGYALGRTVLASDQPLIDRMTNAGGGASFSRLAAEIVASRQFRYRLPEMIDSKREGGL